MPHLSFNQPAGQEGAILPHQFRPRMSAAMQELASAVYQETTLSFREAEAARMRIAKINGCLMCQGYRVANDLQESLARMNKAESANLPHDRGEVPDEAFYAAIGDDWQSSGLFSPRERLAIEYAERIALTPSEVTYDADFWERLHSAFDEGEIADLTFSITTWIATGRVVHVLDLDGACSVAQPA